MVKTTAREDMRGRWAEKKKVRGKNAEVKIPKQQSAQVSVHCFMDINRCK